MCFPQLCYRFLADLGMTTSKKECVNGSVSAKCGTKGWQHPFVLAAGDHKLLDFDVWRYNDEL